MLRNDPIRHRLRAHGLAGAPFTAAEDVVRWLGAMQAQEYAVAKWSIGQRARGVSEADVDAALADGRILRTHVLRPTWHFVLPEDIRWMLALTAPRIRAAMSSYDRKLELDRPLLSRAYGIISRALEGGRHRTRTELAAALDDAGVAARGQRLGHLVMHAELDALIASGAPRGKQQTYALLDERAPAAPGRDRDDALAELATRYFTSRGPATAKDFRWWSSLPAAEATRAIEAAGQRIERHDAGDRTWRLGAVGALPRTTVRAPAAHLLQVYDEYFVAYTESRSIVASDSRLPRGPWDESGFMHPVVVHGRGVGNWRRGISRDGMTIEVRLRERAARAGRASIEQAAGRYGHFLGLPAETLFSRAER